MRQRPFSVPVQRPAPMSLSRKLIEVALPLDAINAAAAREKSIRHGHPSTLHLWWARRPLAAARAVIFAQMVDDPSEYVDVLISDAKKRRDAQRVLKKRLIEHRGKRALSGEQSGDAQVSEPEPTLEAVAAQLERERLFEILKELVRWENTTNEEVLDRARADLPSLDWVSDVLSGQPNLRSDRGSSVTSNTAGLPASSAPPNMMREHW